jgi:hypothetical protein
MDKKNDITFYTNKVKTSNLLYLAGLFFLCFIITPDNSSAELKPLSQTEMKDTTGQQGFTDFSIIKNTARAFIDIHIETAGTIESIKAGYNGGWNNDFTGIKIGSDETPITIDGLVFMADFDNIHKTNRSLKTVILGTNRIQGSISANINSYTGVYNDALIGGSGIPVECNRKKLGDNTTFNYNSNISEAENMGFFMIFSMDGTDPGLKFVSGFDENSSINSLSVGEWWDSK